MKRILAVLLSMMLILSGCSAASMGNSSDESQISDKQNTSSKPMSDQNEKSNEKILSEPKNLSFGGLDDESLLTYAKGSIYSNLVENLNSEEYFVENVDAIYISQEYIDEKAYNSKSNLYFGYHLSDLDKQFKGQRYIFTCGDGGTTVVQEMETLYDNTTEQIIKNVAMGSGVILVCVTVSVVSAGAGAPAVCMIFATAAQTGTTFALSSSVISGAAATITTAYQTHDFEEAFKQGALAASEGFKWGAISGAAMGGASSTYALHGATLNGLSMNDAAAIQMESGYPLDVIKQFKSIREYDVYRKAGLKASQVGNKSALVRKIDLDYVTEIDGVKLTNRELMEKGLAPFDPATGKRYQLHHVNQDPNGTLAILKEAEHQGNASILNTAGADSRIDRPAFKNARAVLERLCGTMLVTDLRRVERMDIADTIMQFENNILGKGKTEKEIFEAEKKLGLRFAIDYRQYLKKYGFAIVNGHELTGLSNILCMNVVEVTETERSKNYLNEKMKEWYVIENLNIDDVLIWQSSSGEIYQVTPESICKIYDSLSEYIWE